MAEKQAVQHKVIHTDAGGRTRVHFAGREQDARAFVESNFPRPHVEPGNVNDRLYADVQLHSPDGAVQEFHGSDAGWVDIDDDGNLVEVDAEDEES